ncbi:hypothetical protein BVC80_1717g4 [Macleaya cordata]|uniref:Zinc finger protein n=1 Tax=Macleaya cordata TaxID=56857 RepID=A0A200Q1X5_MACCD|nr:hypothetical protein BVC80_1717g4 [Macleaya cordata]
MGGGRGKSSEAGLGMVCQMCDQEGHVGIDCPWVYTRCRKQDLHHPNLRTQMVVMVVGALSTGLRRVLGETPRAVIPVVMAGGSCPFLGLCTTMASPT